MRTVLPVSIFFWILLFSLTGYGETLVAGDACRESSRYLLGGQYDEAERFLDRFIQEYPEEPSGYLLKAAALHYRASDYEDFSRGGEFLELLNRVEALALKKCAANRNDLWSSFYLSSARTFRGAWEVSNGSFVHGMMQGRSGANGLARILAADPNFHDARLGNGSYRFWKSAGARGLHLGSLFGDERSRGIAEVREALAKGRLTGPLSHTVLLEMLLDIDPASAAGEASELVKNYPDCRLFAWQLGEAYKKLGNYDAAAGVFERLAEKYANDPVDDGSGQVRCWWKMAVLADTLKKKDECRKYCERIVILGQRESVRMHQAKRLEGARKMLAEMNRERN